MKTVEQALTLWGLEGSTVKLVAARENAVYQVDAKKGRYALRLHRRGYRSDAELSAELSWMAWVGHCGVRVPSPLPSLDGPLLQQIDGIQVDVLVWLEGDTLDVLIAHGSATQKRDFFFRLGETMAHLHNASDKWPKAQACERPKWDEDGLLGDTPLWGRFWDNPALKPEQKELLLTFRSKAGAGLKELSGKLDYGLIHADLVPANVIYNENVPCLIDFDDGGYGYRLFELATALLKHRHNPMFPEFQSALVDGYRGTRPINTEHLPLFMALRAATYVGWNIARISEDPSQERNARFISDSVSLAAQFLENC